MATAQVETQSQHKEDFPLKFCTVCASNQNRFVIPFCHRRIGCDRVYYGGQQHGLENEIGSADDMSCRLRICRIFICTTVDSVQSHNQPSSTSFFVDVTHTQTFHSVGPTFCLLLLYQTRVHPATCCFMPIISWPQGPPLRHCFPLQIHGSAPRPFARKVPRNILRDRIDGAPPRS